LQKAAAGDAARFQMLFDCGLFSTGRVGHAAFFYRESLKACTAAWVARPRPSSGLNRADRAQAEFLLAASSYGPVVMRITYARNRGGLGNECAAGISEGGSFSTIRSPARMSAAIMKGVRNPRRGLRLSP